MDDISPFFGNHRHSLSSRCHSVLRRLLVLMVALLRTDVIALQVIGGSVTVIQGGTAILPCHVIDTNDDLTQISWQRRTREKPRNDNFLTILPREGAQFVNGGDDRFKYIGNFNNKNGTLQLSNVALKDEGRYTCIFTFFPSGNQKTEIPLNLLVPPFTNVKDNLSTLGTEEVLFATCTAAGSKPPAEVRWLTGALGDKVRTTTNSTQYDNGTTTTVSSLFGVPTREINGQHVQCVISGDSLTKEETLPFIIQVYFSPTEVNIRAISEDSFECLTEANSNAKFTWSSFLRRPDNRRTDDDHGPEDDGRHVSLLPYSAGDDHGLHDAPPTPRGAHDDQGPSRRTDEYHGPEEQKFITDQMMTGSSAVVVAV
ncbi:nectin-2 isoform X9 [Oreochromis niloticus]|uniref:nectin-2 isoform X9 n=1 Tax=Oreochromis niloticus TaxID=8128 RepID=UPI000DF13B8C|nr:nectin-2 isoform X9 [Oreochromis niloticus]